MKKFEAPELEVIRFRVEDIITSSSVDDEGGRENEGPIA